MSFGLTFDKLLIIALIAVFLIGPDRLPGYAAQLARLARSLRDMANGAKDRMREEMGPDFDEVDWNKLDPRQYDPRRIIREALLEDDKAAADHRLAAVPSSRYVESAYDQRQRKLGKPRPAPYDAEATSVSDATDRTQRAQQQEHRADELRELRARARQLKQSGRLGDRARLDEAQQPLGAVAAPEPRLLHAAHRGVDAAETSRGSPR